MLSCDLSITWVLGSSNVTGKQCHLGTAEVWACCHCIITTVEILHTLRPEVHVQCRQGYIILQSMSKVGNAAFKDIAWTTRCLPEGRILVHETLVHVGTPKHCLVPQPLPVHMLHQLRAYDLTCLPFTSSPNLHMATSG